MHFVVYCLVHLQYIYGSSNIHTGLDISEQNTKQVEKEVRVQLSLQAEVKDLTKKLTKTKSDLKRVQKYRKMLLSRNLT